jgi:hypothetical protein
MVISNQKPHWARVLFSFNHFRLYVKPSEALSDFLQNRFGRTIIAKPLSDILLLVSPTTKLIPTVAA